MKIALYDPLTRGLYWLAGDPDPVGCTHGDALDWTMQGTRAQRVDQGADVDYATPIDAGNQHESFSFTTIRTWSESFSWYTPESLAANFATTLLGLHPWSGQVLKFLPRNDGAWDLYRADNATLTCDPFSPMGTTVTIVYHVTADVFVQQPWPVGFNLTDGDRLQDDAGEVLKDDAAETLKDNGLYGGLIYPIY